MLRWRVALHALDRTGPPMLAAAWLDWMHRNRPDVEIDVVAFRGGPLEAELGRRWPVRVLLRPSEPWDHAAPDPTRFAELQLESADLGKPDLILLVSVSAGQVLGFLPVSSAPVVGWVVEQGEDLHWLDGPLRVRELVDRWVAGSETTRAELALHLGPDTTIGVASEFVMAPGSSDGPGTTRQQPALVVGAGIGTHRKAPDLFLEVAAAAVRLGCQAEFVWIGGETDALLPFVRAEIDRLGLASVRLVDSTPDLDEWLRSATLFVHPARLDAFPLVCLHAAALGVPVVSFGGVGGVPEMFGEVFSGVPFPDVGGMARLVTELVVAGDRAAELGRRQRRRVQERYLADAAAPRLTTLLDAVSVSDSGQVLR